MKKHDYIKDGRVIGQKIADALAAAPPGDEKATRMIVGVMGVLKPLGTQVTLDLLKAQPTVLEFLATHEIEEEKLEGALREAKKRWKASQQEDELNKPKKARATGEKISSSPVPSHSSHFAPSTQSPGPMFDQPLLASDDAEAED